MSTQINEAYCKIGAAVDLIRKAAGEQDNAYARQYLYDLLNLVYDAQQKCGEAAAIEHEESAPPGRS